MKSIILLMVIGIGATIFAATEFPYGITEMTERNRARSAEVVSFTNPAEIDKVSDMPATDAIATVTAARMTFIAADASNWAASIAKVGQTQAGLAIKYDNGSFHWMGSTANGWTELTGVTAAEGEWDVKVDIDYSLGEDKRKVRYTVGGKVLTAGGNAWLPLGVEATAISHIRLYGEGSCDTVVAKSGERELQGTFTPHEDFGMSCNNLRVDIDMEDAWGIDTAEVSLRDEFGAVVATRTGTIENDSIRVDFSDAQVAGGRYTYDVRLTGNYNGKLMGKDITDIPPLIVGRNVDWFNFTGTGFSKATPTNVVINANAFAAEAEKTGTVNPTEATPEKPVVVLETTLDIQGVYQWDDLPAVTPQFALCIARTKNDNPMKLGARTWACKSGEGEWTAVAANGLPVDNGQYDVKVVLDYRDGQKKGAYFVRQHGDDYTYFKLVEFVLGGTKLNRAAVIGGNVSALAANYTTTAPAELAPPSGSEIVISGNTHVNVSVLNVGEYTLTGNGRKAHLVWTDDKSGDSVSKYVKMVGDKLVVVEGAPANGMDSYNSYVLGLDPEKSSDKPAAVIKTGGIQSASGITVHVPTVSASKLPTTGVDVYFQRQKSTDGGKTWTNDGNPVGVGGSLTIPFTVGALYRVNTVFK